MDRARTTPPNTCSRLIAMAVSLAGSAERVRTAMNCSDADFRDYCRGTREANWIELGRLVDLIVLEQAKLIAKNRAAIAAIRAGKRPPRDSGSEP